MPEARRVLLGVCGGVAAYKAAELVRELQRRGAEVRVMMTRAAQEFVRPLTFAALTGHKVFTSMWEPCADGAAMEHIEQAQWAEVFLIAPATAHTLARLSAGLADDLLSTTYLATDARVVLAPAMNVRMWNHAATRANLETLERRGHRIVAPGSGYLACGMTGDGRLADTETIVQAVFEQEAQRVTSVEPVLTAQDLAGETVLVTAGGTREPIDAVRYIGNRSSGRMGYALAEAAQRRGARVILVSAARTLPVPAGCELMAVETAEDMHAAVLYRLAEATIVIKAAAVSDFRVREVSANKLHRDAPPKIELEPTEDIVRAVIERRARGTLVLAFAAEMGLDVERAREKLRRKGADAIFLNDISQEGVGFDAERNAGVFLSEAAEVRLPEMAKSAVADRILDEMVLLRAAKVVAQ
ncbi:MAG: bifunctional phosphopantothenoylcysteine decarboxylase/phosphopantothenate--cysteine ligase CoaBC [Acidobacteriaceae bacterium]